ncbi:DUF4283 domain-containing protein, partial [Shigella flexneri]|nr:DUF4283 domain-containing protein [Shigella flexneri]
VWISMPNLPIQFYRKDSICSLAKVAGNPIKIDQGTASLSRPSMARVCVEMDLLQEPPKRVWIMAGSTGFWQQLLYEKIPKYCVHCLRQGHDKAECKL